MAYTPLIKKLNRQGSTFYTFSSAAKDLSRCLGNSSLLEFRFSHFALLNIPDIVNALTPNTTVRPPEAKGNRLVLYPYDGDTERFVWKTNFAQHGKETGFMLACMLQNYVFNFEERLISHTVTTESDRSVAERVFWHWLYHTGAIGWRDAVKGAECTTGRNRRIEGRDDVEKYDRVVQYLGNIDVTNSVDINSDSYTELYIHVPAEAGYTPKVLWFNDNDNTDELFNRDAVYECENRLEIFGQDGENPAYDAADDDPSGLSYYAVYDFDPVNGQDDCYITEDTDNEGVCIDFDAESYWDIMNAADVNTMDEYNAGSLSDTFEFNAVLLYYDIIDKSTGTRTSNLYGVMFLDDIKAVNGSEYIQRYPKYKPTEGAVNGNSYGFKMNLRIDIEPNKQGITTLVNEYNTYSMGLFADAVMRIQECTNTFMHLREEQYALARKYEELETIFKSLYSVDALKERVDELEVTIENAGLALSDSSSLLDLIYSNSKSISDLVKGGLPNSLAIGLDVIRAGYGAGVDTSDGKSAIVSMTGGGWQQCAVYPLNAPAAGNLTPSVPMSLGDTERGDNRLTGILREGNNMVRVYTDPAALCRYDIEVYIDDSLTSWRNGQTIRLVFPSMPKDVLNTRRIVLYTDKSCRSGEQQSGLGYGCMAVISPSMLIGDNPIIDIVCIDETFTLKNGSLVADVIR